MAAVRKFLFDVSFDEPRPQEETVDVRAVAEPVVEVVVPTFSAEELEAARTDGYAAGHEAAGQEAAASIDARIAAALAVIGERLAWIAEATANAGAEASRSAMSLAAAIVAKMFPELARRHGTDEIVAVVAAIVARFRDESRLVVRVDSDLRDDVAKRIDGVVATAAFPGTVSVVADPAIAPGDCQIEWSHGGAERNTETLWQDIDAIVASGLAGPRAVPADEAPPAEAEAGATQDGTETVADAGTKVQPEGEAEVAPDDVPAAELSADTTPTAPETAAEPDANAPPAADPDTGAR